MIRSIFVRIYSPEMSADPDLDTLRLNKKITSEREFERHWIFITRVKQPSFKIQNFQLSKHKDFFLFVTRGTSFCKTDPDIHRVTLLNGKRI
jgi:hypothetical protein